MLVQEKFAPEEIRESGEIAASIYLNEIPSFVEEELQRLYGSIRSSLPYIRFFKSTDQVNTYVAWKGKTPTAVLLLRVQKRCIVVLNERVRIGDDELRRFVAYALKRFPLVGIIRFESVHADLRTFPYPLQRNPADEDLIIRLPSTPEEYTASLRKKTRWHIKRKLAVLKQDFSSIRFETYEKDAIDERLFYHLINLKESRITAKKQTFNINKDHAKHLLRLARLCGVFNVIWIDGHLGAGVIEYRFGADQDGELTVHDPRYDQYSLGIICNYLSICECITKGVKRYHFGAGRNLYKIQLGSVPQNMEQLDIYRSPARMLMNCDWVTTVWVTTRIRRIGAWLEKHEASLLGRVAFRTQRLLREFWKKS